MQLSIRFLVWEFWSTISRTVTSHWKWILIFYIPRIRWWKFSAKSSVNKKINDPLEVTLHIYLSFFEYESPKYISRNLLENVNHFLLALDMTFFTLKSFLLNQMTKVLRIHSYYSKLFRINNAKQFIYTRNYISWDKYKIDF